MIEELDSFPNWANYARYCELKEKGLRKQALSILRVFIQQMLSRPLKERIEFVNWLEEVRLRYRDGVRLTPVPLYEELIKPTLELWIETEPKNPLPYRWQDTIESVNKAIELDPNDQTLRKILFWKIIGYVDYNHHELRHYGYIGNAAEDLEMLEDLRKKMQSLSEPDLQKAHPEIDIRVLICKGWLAYIEQNYDSYQFPDFLQRYAPEANIDDIL